MARKRRPDLARVTVESAYEPLTPRPVFGPFVGLFLFLFLLLFNESNVLHFSLSNRFHDDSRLETN